MTLTFYSADRKTTHIIEVEADIAPLELLSLVHEWLLQYPIVEIEAPGVTFCLDYTGYAYPPKPDA